MARWRSAQKYEGETQFGGGSGSLGEQKGERGAREGMACSEGVERVSTQWGGLGEGGGGKGAGGQQWVEGGEEEARAMWEGKGVDECRAGDGTVEEQTDLYFRESERFLHDADLEAMTRLAVKLSESGMCNGDYVILIGGVNEGQVNVLKSRLT